MSKGNSKSHYNLFYQRIIGAKTVLGWKFLSYKQREIEHIIDYIQERGNNGLILDVGCSTGRFTRALAAAFGQRHVQGADISEKSIARCRKHHPETTFHHITDGFYTERRGEYKYVLLSHVVEHRDDPLAMIQEVSGLLREDGALIVCVPQERIRGDSALPENLYNLIRLKFENVHRIKHSLETLTPLLSQAGLSINQHRYIHAFKSGKDQRSFANHSLVVYAKQAGDT